MNRILTPLRVEAAFWLVLCGGLAAGIGVETDWGQQMELTPPRIKMAPAAFSKPALTDPYQLGPADQFLETSLRPLFVVTRRPAPPPPPPEAPKPRMKKGQFRLTGITIVPEGKFAFLIEIAGNKSRVVGEGKEINGIVVKEISPRRIVLQQYDDSEVLTLQTAKGPAVAPVPTVPSPAPAAAAPSAQNRPPPVPDSAGPR